MRKLIFSKYFFLSILILFNIFGCSAPKKSKDETYCFYLGTPCIRKNVQVEMITTRGRVVFELNGNSAPVTTTNFIFLVKKGFYDGTSFDRAIKKPFPFVIQGGFKDSEVNIDNTIDKLSESYFDKESVNLRPIPLEIKLRGDESPLYNKFVRNNGNFNRIILTHQRGSLAMARMQRLDSGRIKFYIALKDLPELDGRYAVFGKVIKGMNIVDKIKEGDVILRMKELIK